MSIHVTVQAGDDYVAHVIEPLPGMRQLVVGGDEGGLVIQIPARIGGLVDTARLSWSLSTAAREFAEWCDEQERTRSADA